MYSTPPLTLEMACRISTSSRSSFVSLNPKPVSSKNPKRGATETTETTETIVCVIEESEEEVESRRFERTNNSFHEEGDVLRVRVALDAIADFFEYFYSMISMHLADCWINDGHSTHVVDVFFRDETHLMAWVSRCQKRVSNAMSDAMWNDDDPRKITFSDLIGVTHVRGLDAKNHIRKAGMTSAQDGAISALSKLCLGLAWNHDFESEDGGVPDETNEGALVQRKSYSSDDVKTKIRICIRTHCCVSSPDMSVPPIVSVRWWKRPALGP